MKKLAEALKQAREKAELSQGEVAKALGYSSPQFVSNMERGLCSIPPRKAAAFCKLTGMKPAKLRELMIETMTRQLDKGLGLGRAKKEKATATKQAEA